MYKLATIFILGNITLCTVGSTYFISNVCLHGREFDGKCY